MRQSPILHLPPAAPLRRDSPAPTLPAGEDDKFLAWADLAPAGRAHRPGWEVLLTWADLARVGSGSRREWETAGRQTRGIPPIHNPELLRLRSIRPRSRTQM